MTDISGFTFNNMVLQSAVKASNATSGTIALTRAVNCTFNNTTLGGGRVFENGCLDVTFNNTIYYDSILNTFYRTYVHFDTAQFSRCNS
jgi:hypothetical protein